MKSPYDRLSHVPPDTAAFVTDDMNAPGRINQIDVKRDRPSHSARGILFDAYGTLFDVYSIGALAEKLFPENGKTLAELWRSKQIEYAQLRTLCSTYKPFWEVTQDALLFSCKKLK